MRGGVSFGIANLGHLSHQYLNHVGVIIGRARGMIDRDTNEAAKEKVSNHTGFHDRDNRSASCFKARFIAGDLEIVVGALDLHGARRVEKPFAFGVHELTGGTRDLSCVLSSFNGDALLCTTGD